MSRCARRLALLTSARNIPCGRARGAVEDGMDKQIDRREFVRLVGVGAGAAVLAACAPQGGGPAAASASAAGSAQPLTLPIVNAPLSLSYWAPMSSNVIASMKSFAEIGCYKELEKRTGIHINFQHPPLNAELEQFNLVIASGKYPDIIEYNWLQSAPGGPARYVKDGVVIRLNQLIDQYAPNLKKVLADHPDWRKQIVTDEGDIYAFPFIRGDIRLAVSAGMALRRDWLDKLSLSTPSTLDDWQTVLRTFKDKHPNGNSKADELPLSTWAAVAGSGTGARGAFSRYSFIGAYGIGIGWVQDHGAMQDGPPQPAFPEVLAKMTQRHKEGLTH